MEDRIVTVSDRGTGQSAVIERCHLSLLSVRIHACPLGSLHLIPFGFGIPLAGLRLLVQRSRHPPRPANLFRHCRHRWAQCSIVISFNLRYLHCLLHPRAFLCDRSRRLGEPVRDDVICWKHPHRHDGYSRHLHRQDLRGDEGASALRRKGHGELSNKARMSGRQPPRRSISESCRSSTALRVINPDEVICTSARKNVPLNWESRSLPTFISYF
jgi:hypothetical protein